MRAHLLPPPARHAFGASARLGWALCGLGLTGLAALAAWQVVGADQFPGAGLALWAGSAALAWRWWSTLPRGQLHWEGACWSVQTPAAADPLALAAAPQVRLDLQTALLLYVRPLRGRGMWLWLGAGQGESALAAWLALRRALYSRAPEAPAQAGHDGAPLSHDRPG